MNKPTIYFLFFNIIFLFTGRLNAQEIDVSKVSDTDVEWSEGTVILSDGKKLSGLLKLNTKTGLLAFESGATSRSFTARSVQTFEFFDNLQNKKRSFLSVVYSDPNPSDKNVLGGTKNRKTVPEQPSPQFYEILIELKAFAILSTTAQLNIKTKGNNNPSYFDPATNTWTPGFKTQQTEYSQTETLLIFDAEGNITPLLEVTNRDIDGSLFDRSKTKTKKLDTEIIEKHTSPNFEKLEEYAKQNKLSFKKRDDLLKILEYYKQFESN